MSAYLDCPHCQQPTPVLVFHENGLSSCRKCAPEVRKLNGNQKEKDQPHVHKTARGYLIAR